MAHAFFPYSNEWIRIRPDVQIRIPKLTPSLPLLVHAIGSKWDVPIKRQFPSILRLVNKNVCLNLDLLIVLWMQEILLGPAAPSFSSWLNESLHYAGAWEAGLVRPKFFTSVREFKMEASVCYTRKSNLWIQNQCSCIHSIVSISLEKSHWCGILSIFGSFNNQVNDFLCPV